MLRIDGDGNRITLSGRFTIGHVAELLAFLRAREFGSDPEIDLAGVSDFDSAGVQLLLALQRELHRQGRCLRLTRPSAAVSEVFALYELSTHFGAPARAPVGGGA